MKKYLSLFIIVIVLSLTGCGESSTPASNKAIACANEAVEIGENYLSYEITYTEATSLLNELQKDMSYVTTDDNNQDEHHVADLSISIAIQSLNTALMNDEHGGSNKTYDEVQAAIEALKEKIEEFK